MAEVEENVENKFVIYDIALITPEYEEKVLELLRKSFFKDETLNAALKILDDSNGKIPEIEEHCLKIMKENMSFLAVTDDKIVIGVSLNGIVKKGEPLYDPENCPNPKIKKIYKLLNFVDEQTDVFGKYPDIDQYLDLQISAVDPDFRKMGIHRALKDSTKRLAEEMNIPLLHSVATGEFSAKGSKAIGMECIFSLNYSDYLDENGKPLIESKPPHTKIEAYAMLIFNNQ